MAGAMSAADIKKMDVRLAAARERYSDPDWYAKEMGTWRGTTPTAAPGTPVPGAPTTPGAPATDFEPGL